MTNIATSTSLVTYEVNSIKPDVDRLHYAARLLREGGVVGYPTDTLYGLAVDPRLPKAIARLFNIKRRPDNLAIPLIACDLEQVETVGILTPIGRRLASAFWPGPLSLVVDARPNLDRSICAGGDSVAVRVPAQPVACGLAATLGHPVTATSANRSGEPAATLASEVLEKVGRDLDILLDGGDLGDGLPSTIIDVRDSQPILLRKGQVPWERVLQSLK